MGLKSTEAEPSSDPNGLHTPMAVPGVICPRGELRDRAIALEHRRRRYTWTGSMLLIPASGLAMLVGCALLGIRGAWLAICFAVGLSAGPAFTLCSFALNTLIGRQLVRAKFRKQCRLAGVSPTQTQDIWREAVETVEAQERAIFDGRSHHRRHTVLYPASPPAR